MRVYPESYPGIPENNFEHLSTKKLLVRTLEDVSLKTTYIHLVPRRLCLLYLDLSNPLNINTMKNSIFYCLVLLLIVASCKQDNKEADTSTEESVKKEVASKSESRPVVTECFSDQKILPEAAFLWQGGWIYLYNFDLFSKEEGDAYKKSPQTFFDETVMTILYNEVAEEDRANAGVLISYISTPQAANDSFMTPPGLAIQNIVDCNKASGGTIYIYPYQGINGAKLGEPYNGNPELSNQSDLDVLKQNWVNQITTPSEKRNVYSLTESYIHSWKSLMDNGIGKNATDIGISVNLGLRTLEPGEEDDFPTNPGSNPDGTAGAGAIVYVNVLYFGGTEWKNDDSFPYMDNFARPCPIYCN